MKNKIKNIIFKTIGELNETLKNKIPLDKGLDIPIFGGKGYLDSLGLVNLLVSIEQNIEDEFDINLTIADERAMSQRNSPFRTIGTLVKYIELLLSENQ